MGTPRHGKQKSSGHRGWMITALILLLVLSLGCAALAVGIATNRITWEASPATEPTAVPTEAATPADTTAPSKQPSTSTTAAAVAGHYKQTKVKEWSLLLVNSWNTLPDGYEQATTYVDYDNAGNRIDTRIKDALDQMMSDGEEYGLWGVLLYRDGETQQQYFDAVVKEWKAKGYSDSDARSMAATEVIRPGTSERQTGLALDILGSGYTDRQESFDQSKAFQWLKAHCADYGFILRYPKGKEQITGMDYEPWHYRYVGKEYAKEIMSRGITLEEFLQEKGW